MEDQRNWTDDSYKTYCTPLRLPFPVEVAAGTRLGQSVTLTLTGAVIDSPEMADAGPLAITVGDEAIGKLPALGVGLASHGRRLSGHEVHRLSALHLAHLRVDLRLGEEGWRDQLRRAGDAAMGLGAALEPAVFLSAGREAAELAALAAALDSLAAALGTARPPIARWLIFDAARKVTSGASVALARRMLGGIAPGAPFGGGTDAYFTELNRDRPDPAHLDLATYSINPQVHAFDDPSLIETLSCQGTTVESARQFLGALPLAISPVTLRPRFNPDATAAEEAPADGGADEMPFAVDPRQMSLFGVAWTLGSLAALAASGVASATFYETVGPRGVMESADGAPWPEFRSIPGGVFPLYHVLADAGEFAGGEVLRGSGIDPRGVAILALRLGGRRRILLANLRPERRQLALDLPDKGASMRLLDATNAERAMSEPEEFRAASSLPVAADGGRVLLDLPPYTGACVDAIDE